MSNKIINKVLDETVDTTIDKIDELLVDYMFEYGNYEETDENFLSDHQMYRELVIKEMYKRLVETGVYNLHIR